jgi:hypothetical protein
LNDFLFLVSIFFNFFLISMVFYFWSQYTSSKKELASKIDSIVMEKKQSEDALKLEIESLDKELKQLEPYKEIIDIKSYSDEIKSSAENIAKVISDEAESYKAKLEVEAETTIIKAKADAKEIKLKSEERMADAIEKSNKIIALAKVQAEEIAGDALIAKENSDLWKKAETAARNIVKGYGDEYVIPNQSLLDDLAENYSHKDAGKELKQARSIVKDLIKANQAADCSYSEPYRRETAIRFIVDAYVGKVDTILTQVRHNNYGVLKQKIDDAFSIVNVNGKAFRDAHILDAFHFSRLEELRLAVVCSELKMLEQEEQRAIREQIREEEKARKEYEKAIKESEKEERILSKAIEKARLELEEAKLEQRAEFEKELADLQQKLYEAELRNERAISMAQQTKRGHVYVISNIGSFGEDVFKIGMTRRLEPLDRVRELGDASVPFSFDVHAMIFSEDAPALENSLHRAFAIKQLNKVNSRKEFFKVTLLDIKETIESMDIDAHWTLVAEAHEYKESLAIEQALKDGKKLHELQHAIRVH